LQTTGSPAKAKRSILVHNDCHSASQCRQCTSSAGCQCTYGLWSSSQGTPTGPALRVTLCHCPNK